MGHRSVHALHLRHVACERVIEAISARLAKVGFERTASKPGAAAGEVRMAVRGSEGSVLVELRSIALRPDAGVDAWLAEEWAAHLSTKLVEPVLALSIFEDGYATTLARFEGGKEVASFTIDEGAAASRMRRFPVPSTLFGAGKRAPKIVLEADCEGIADALGKVLGVPRAWLNPYVAGEPAPGDEVLVFRRRVEAPLLPKGKEPLTGFEPEIAAYRGRDHVVGALAFDASADLETVGEHLSSFLQAFSPPGGLAVRAARGTKREVLAGRFSRTSTVSARQLARGGTLELSEHYFEPVAGRCVTPLFWIASRGEVDQEDEDDVPMLRFGLSIARPGADAPERAIAHALRTLFGACVELGGCISAVLTAQRPPLSLAAPSLAYERLAGTVEEGARAGWLRSHVRCPGWLVLVPRGPARSIAKNVPAEVTVERVRCGLLAGLDAPTPFAMTSTSAMERWLSPLLA